MIVGISEKEGGGIWDEEEVISKREFNYSSQTHHFHPSNAQYDQSPNDINSFENINEYFLRRIPFCITAEGSNTTPLRVKNCDRALSLFGIYIGLNDKKEQVISNFFEGLRRSCDSFPFRIQKSEEREYFLLRNLASWTAGFSSLKKSFPDVDEKGLSAVTIRCKGFWNANGRRCQKSHPKEKGIRSSKTKEIQTSLINAYKMASRSNLRLDKDMSKPDNVKLERKSGVFCFIWILFCCSKLLIKVEHHLDDNLISVETLWLILIFGRAPSERSSSSYPNRIHQCSLRQICHFVSTMKYMIFHMKYAPNLVKMKSGEMATSLSLLDLTWFRSVLKWNPGIFYSCRQGKIQDLSADSIIRNKSEIVSPSRSEHCLLIEEPSVQAHDYPYKSSKAYVPQDFLFTNEGKKLPCDSQNSVCDALKDEHFLNRETPLLFRRHKRKDLSYEAFLTSQRRSPRENSFYNDNERRPCHFRKNNLTDVRGCKMSWCTMLQLGTLFFVMGFLNDFASGICPMVCTCKWKNGKQTVECVNKGLDSIPTDMDPGTQVLDLSQNPLVVIPQKKFKVNGLTNLQKIYASKCNLFQLDDTAFYGLSNLVELDLSRNELRMIPAISLNYLTSLMRLHLSNNQFNIVKNNSFRRLQYLVLLDLSSCAIEGIEPFSFQGLNKLEWLMLENNKLSTVPHNVVLPKSLLGIGIHKNPWNCDCNLKPLQEWMVLYDVPTSNEPICSEPLRMRSKLIRNVDSEQFACLPEVRPTSLFLDVLEGKNVSFECHVKSVPEAIISWRFNDQPLENTSFHYDETTSLYVFEEKDLNQEKVSFLHIETVTEAHNGIFQCFAKNIAGRMTSNFTLRVSVLTTTQPPKVIVIDRVIYIGVGLALFAVIICVVACFLIIRCCRKFSRSSKRKQNKSISITNSVREKESITRQRSGNMPKYIQMGTPAPKVNGIIDCSPISVIETSPYRTEQSGTVHMNPDLIADGPNDRNKPQKKKVSIVGVEEMDESGVRTTRRLDDILEETEEPFDPNYERLPNKLPYEGAITSSNEAYTDLHKQLNSYPLTSIPSNEHPQYFEQQTLPRNYSTIRDKQTWQESNGVHLDHFPPLPQEQVIPHYATIKRNRRSPSPRADLLHDQKYPETYNIPPCDNSMRPPDSRYQQNYGIVHTKSGENSFACECCQNLPSVQTEMFVNQSLRTIRGDGCSFDNLLSSCGGQCCYNHQPGHIFDNTLPENYRPLEPNPPPPAGYGDSEDEESTQKNWEEETLSPGTRILYSPEEPYDKELIKQTSLSESTGNT